VAGLSRAARRRPPTGRANSGDHADRPAKSAAPINALTWINVGGADRPA